MHSASRSSNQPLTSGDQRRRLLRHHVPLALASAVVLVLFMNVPTFDANVYPHADTFSGVFPQQRGERGTMDQDGGQTETTGHGREQGPSAEEEHGRGQSLSSEVHGGNQTGPMDQGAEQAGTTGHGGGQSLSSEEIPSDSFLGFSIRGFTVATGYVATGLLGLTLLIGPVNLLLRRRNPVSGYLRRDMGTWTVIFSVVHVIYGLQVHDRLSNFLNYFVAPDGSPLTNSFGLANWTGLAATVIMVGLLALSGDFALRKLKARRWKNIQRLNYALFALVIAHAFFYGALVRTGSPYTLLLVLSVIAVFVGQTVGVWLWRRQYSRTTVKLADAAR